MLQCLGTLYLYSVAGSISDPRPLSFVPTTSSDEVKKMIMELDKRFDKLKDNVRECLEKHKIAVRAVADVLTSLSPDDDEHHQMFLESRVVSLYTAVNHSVLFGTMNFHWNYLDPSLLDHLVRKLDLEEVKVEMKVYKSDLQQFRIKTPLTLFCRTQRRKRIKLSPEFQEVVAEFDIPDNRDDVTLEVVEQFRQEYASHYQLHEFAMMIAQVLPGSFIVTWFIPESIVGVLKERVPTVILKKYSVTKLTVSGTCVYLCPSKEEVI